jgi:CelD/BcsL family acetyltransferase involved in cellulose biosynthesis
VTLTATVVRPQDLGSAEVAAWREMQRSSPQFANPFLSPGFSRAAGQVRPSARVAVLQDGPDVVGFFPFEQAPLRVGRPIAAGICDLQAVVHVPGLEWTARELLDGCRLDVLEFDHLIGGQAAASGQRFTARSAPLIDLSDGYEAYLDAHMRTSKKIFRSTFAKERKLDREVGTIRFEFDIHDSDALRVLMHWKSAQYRRTGQRDRFAVPWIERMVLDLFETPFEGCVGTLSVLYVGERVLAAHFGLRSDIGLSCWFPAYDAEASRYSPGLILHLKMAQAAAAEGLVLLDLGKGDEEYKQSLKSGDAVVGEGWIERPSAAAFVRRVRRGPGRLASGMAARYPALRRAARGGPKQRRNRLG